jgi:hypothetical protein
VPSLRRQIRRCSSSPGKGRPLREQPRNDVDFRPDQPRTSQHYHSDFVNSHLTQQPLRDLLLHETKYQIMPNPCCETQWQSRNDWLRAVPQLYEKQRQQLRKARVRAQNLKSSYFGVRRTPKFRLAMIRPSDVGTAWRSLSLPVSVNKLPILLPSHQILSHGGFLC